MRQAYLHAIDRLELREVAAPDPGPGEIRVRIRASLSCGTDLKILRQGHARVRIPGPFGHEGSGDVEAVGSGVRGIRAGDPVMWVPTAPCDRCLPCSRGLANQCLHLFEEPAFGTHADAILLPSRIVRRNLFPKPDHLGYAAAALLEPLACVVRGQRRLLPAGRMLIVGVGAIGLLHVAVARARGVEEIWVVGGRRKGLALAKKLGAQQALRGRLESLEPELRSSGGDLGFDAVIECTGDPSVWRRAPFLARPGGEVLLFGGLAGPAEAAFSAARIHYEEVTLKGSFHYAPEDVREAYRLLTGGTGVPPIPWEDLITDRLPLENLIPGMRTLLSGYDGVKIAFSPELPSS